jgi:predicted MPP superfamily phosphohydrolase
MKINEINVKTTKNVEDKNIALLSDIHVEYNTPSVKLNKIVEDVKRLEPTQIMIPGDLYNSNDSKLVAFPRDTEKVLNFIRKLSEIANVYISLGNSELELTNNQGQFPCIDPSTFYRDDILAAEMCPYSTKMNNPVHFVGQETFHAIHAEKDYTISGLTPSLSFYKKDKERVAKLIEKYEEYINMLTAQLNPEQYNILLTHNPIIIDAYEKIASLKKFDLVLSGHNHGGLIDPKLKPFLALIPGIDSKRLFPKYVKGAHAFDNTTFVVSEGITKFHSNCGFLANFEKSQEGTIDLIKVRRK